MSVMTLIHLGLDLSILMSGRPLTAATCGECGFVENGSQFWPDSLILNTLWWCCRAKSFGLLRLLARNLPVVDNSGRPVY